MGKHQDQHGSLLLSIAALRGWGPSTKTSGVFHNHMQISNRDDDDEGTGTLPGFDAYSPGTLPLPFNFFQMAPLSIPELVQYHAFGKQTIDELLSAAQAPVGLAIDGQCKWKEWQQVEGCHLDWCERKTNDGDARNDFLCVRGSIRVAATVEEMMAHLVSDGK